MTAPFDLLLSVVIGASVVLASRGQLRLATRPWFASRQLAALVSLELMLLAPGAAYRYLFHPDWAFMYLLDTSGYSGMLAAGSLLLVVAAGVGTFWLGDFCARTGRLWLLLLALAVALAGLAVVVAVGSPRLAVVGSFAGWTGTYGLRPLGDSDLLLAMLVMGACLAVGWFHVLFRFAREGIRLARASR